MQILLLQLPAPGAVLLDSKGKYLDEFLLLEIKRHLLDDKLTLQEISNNLNFDEPTNLVKFFKRLEKQTPIEFRKIVSQISSV